MIAKHMSEIRLWLGMLWSKVIEYYCIEKTIIHLQNFREFTMEGIKIEIITMKTANTEVHYEEISQNQYY